MHFGIAAFQNSNTIYYYSSIWVNFDFSASSHSFPNALIVLRGSKPTLLTLCLVSGTTEARYYYLC